MQDVSATQAFVSCIQNMAKTSCISSPEVLSFLCFISSLSLARYDSYIHTLCGHSPLARTAFCSKYTHFDNREHVCTHIRRNTVHTALTCVLRNSCTLYAYTVSTHRHTHARTYIMYLYIRTYIRALASCVC